ncbi:MAG: tRNA preQ1(34) S-adenosylmethionine ribosyltransferase-isomerase QueA [Phycisphaerales bacterium]|nr:tRNA preQ1(34) S-adenosylmethionine ribosyltransferase-isomerase QueA [Phycisphaerales bacterium]
MGDSGRLAPVDARPLLLSDLEYELPAELIAQRPAADRDGSRLLVLDRADDSFSDGDFVDLPSLVNSDDLVVVNDTRVVPAKLSARRATGGKVSGLFVRVIEGRLWEVLLTQTSRLKTGERLNLLPAEYGDALVLTAHDGGGRWRAELQSDVSTDAVLERVGRTPLPPYIRRGAHNDNDEIDRASYQTVFAARPGAVAAPTAALHFTPRVLAAMEQRGVERATVTLHVGPGTFAPVAETCLDDHAMHGEWFDMPAATADAIRSCRARSGRVLAIGTTTARVLETCAAEGDTRASSGWTGLFIKPPYAFRCVDALLTNFHLPRSTLLALVMAFAGRALTRRAYAHAVASRYRFYSYGDAMLIV